MRGFLTTYATKASLMSVVKSTFEFLLLRGNCERDWHDWSFEDLTDKVKSLKLATKCHQLASPSLATNHPTNCGNLSSKSNRLSYSNSISFHISRLALVQFPYNFLLLAIPICTVWNSESNRNVNRTAPGFAQNGKNFSLERALTLKNCLPLGMH